MNAQLNSMAQLSESDLKKFFYAAAESDVYDASVEMVAPHYRLMHQTVLDLLKYHFGVYHGRRVEDVTGTILDIGSGTGAECIPVMRTFPNIKIVALDLIPPMHEMLRNNFERAFPGVEMATRVTECVPANILGEGGEPSALLEIVRKRGEDGFKAVISGFTLHHLSTLQKQEAYKRAYEVLTEGGVLINGDLFSYSPSDPETAEEVFAFQPSNANTFASRPLSAYADHYDLKWISDKFNDPEEAFTRQVSEDEKRAHQEALALSQTKRQSLAEKWSRHYENDNILDPVELQMKMLRNVGFRSTGCPFRFWQVGVLFGQK